MDDYIRKINIIKEEERVNSKIQVAKTKSLAVISWNYMGVKNYSYDQHLRFLGLVDPLNPQEKKKIRSRAQKIAKKIKRHDKERPQYKYKKA
jgi:hypothetical protein